MFDPKELNKDRTPAPLKDAPRDERTRPTFKEKRRVPNPWRRKNQLEVRHERKPKGDL